MLTNEELIDTMLVDVNTLPRMLFDGQYISFCGRISEIARKLVTLKKGIRADLDSKNEVIEQLKAQLREIGCNVQDIPAESLLSKDGKDGESDGS